MKYPTLQEERKLWKKGYKRAVCLDEAGRGPLAGPVVAAAAALQISNDKFLIQKQFQKSKFKKLVKNLKFKIKNLQLRDSKKLTPKKREELYKLIIKNPNIKWGRGRVSEKVIDKINILEATKLAMKKAVENLEKKLRKKIFSKKNVPVSKKNVPNSSDRLNKGQNKFLVDFLIIDGNFKINLLTPQKSIVKADERVFSCAVASIIAKVYRDRIMEKYHQKYPNYSFDRHKGYPTKLHIKMLKKYGPSKIHRKSFKPVKEMQKSKTELPFMEAKVKKSAKKNVSSFVSH